MNDKTNLINMNPNSNPLVNHNQLIPIDSQKSNEEIQLNISNLLHTLDWINNYKYDEAQIPIEPNEFNLLLSTLKTSRNKIKKMKLKAIRKNLKQEKILSSNQTQMKANKLKEKNHVLIQINTQNINNRAISLSCNNTDTHANTDDRVISPLNNETPNQSHNHSSINLIKEDINQIKTIESPTDMLGDIKIAFDQEMNTKVLGQTDDEIVKNLIIRKKIMKQKSTKSKRSYSMSCYVCKVEYEKFHYFYDQLCPSCADFNYEKRNKKCDFTGKIALVTGGRIKIGYEIVLYLLRNNCTVFTTTRFPKDAFIRFVAEPDFQIFKDRLIIYPLDLRDLNEVNRFIEHLYKTLPKLDIIINNAAQTIRRDPTFYKHLLQIESQPLDSFNNSAIAKCLPQDFGLLGYNDQCGGSSHQTLELIENKIHLEFKNDVGERNFNVIMDSEKAGLISKSVILSQIPLTNSDFETKIENFPKNMLDINYQQVDLSTNTSWIKEVDDIEFVEFAETQVINAWAPYIICSRLKKLMEKGVQCPKFIVNVSSMEGIFNYKSKKSRHPHTNMAKASVNMLTRTCGKYFAKDNIFMTSVDTGWVTEMVPSMILQSIRTVPLDEKDGAMRVLDPIIMGLNTGQTLHSVFLKNYKIASW